MGGLIFIQLIIEAPEWAKFFLQLLNEEKTSVDYELVLIVSF